MPAETDVYNLFIPQEGLASYERNRQRQAIIPDLRIVLPVDRESKSVLEEIKVFSISQIIYQPTWEERGVDRRADQLHNECVNKAWRVDTLYCKTHTKAMWVPSKPSCQLRAGEGAGVRGFWGGQPACPPARGLLGHLPCHSGGARVGED